jgi:hypothetical protein
MMHDEQARSNAQRIVPQPEECLRRHLLDLGVEEAAISVHDPPN